MLCWKTLGPGIHGDATWYTPPSTPFQGSGTPQWQWPVQQDNVRLRITKTAQEGFEEHTKESKVLT